MADGKRYRIISCDGGGIRGLVTAIWLADLERHLGGRLARHIDLIAGTSTGSILAAAVACGIPADRIVALYRERGRVVFPGSWARRMSSLSRVVSQGAISRPKYDDAGLAKVLRAEFGDRRLGDLASGPRLLITTYNTLTREALVFKTHRKEFERLPLWEVVKASCSAPTYFPAHELVDGPLRQPLIDGGVVANNPTACAIAEGVKLNSEGGAADPCQLEHFAVGSFGTGQLTRPYSMEDVREWGPLEWAVPIIDVLFDGAADATDYIARQLIKPDRYLRAQVRLDAAYDDMDNADETNLNALVNLAHEYLRGPGGAQLERFADLIR